MSSPQKKSLFIVNFITGASDGLLLPMAAAIVTLFLFGDDESWKAMGICLLVSLAGALVFGLARFFGEKEEIYHHHPEIAAAEAEKEAALMQAIDIDPALRETMLRQMEAEKEQWLKEIKEHQLDWEQYDPARARRSGLQTAVGFLCGGILISLLIFGLCYIMQLPIIAFLVAALVLYGFGWYKGRLLGRNAIRSGMQQLAVGLVFMVAALVVGQFINLSGMGELLLGRA